MKELFKMVRCKEKVFFVGMIKKYTKANLCKANCMERVPCIFPMGKW